MSDLTGQPLAAVEREGYSEGSELIVCAWTRSPETGQRWKEKGGQGRLA